MARLTITEAIKQSPIGRTAFYAKINKGLISVSIDGDDKYIDSSELVRVFGDSIRANEQETKKPNNTELENELTEQAHTIEHLTERLADANERINDYKKTMQLLESPNKLEAERLAREREQLNTEREQLNKERIKLIETINRPNVIVRLWRSLGEKSEN